MRSAYQGLAHPKEFINRTVGRAFVGRRPGRASILTGEHAYFSTEVEKLRFIRMDRQAANRSLRQQSADVAPLRAAVNGLPHVAFGVAAESDVNSFVVSRVDGDPGAVAKEPRIDADERRSKWVSSALICVYLRLLPSTHWKSALGFEVS